jgi:FKBP-type peptidyl-prolyl cis-trans isomerase
MKIYFLILLITSTFLYSCREKQAQLSDTFIQKTIYQKEQDQNIEMNKNFVAEQIQFIDSIIKTDSLFKTKSFQTTSTGLYYSLSGEGIGTSPKSGDYVAILYHSYLLPSKELAYNTLGDTTYNFLLEKDRFERGVQEGLMLMKEGQKATFILPSHLAHGLTGDNDLVPPGSIMWFEVELKKVKLKSKD